MTQNTKHFLNEKNVKIMNQEHAFESVYNIEMLNSFKPELQLKDIESASKSKLIDLLSKLSGFKFVITLVLVYKKLENEAKTKYDNFYSSSKTEIITNENDTDDVFQSIHTILI